MPPLFQYIPGMGAVPCPVASVFFRLPGTNPPSPFGRVPLATRPLNGPPPPAALLPPPPPPFLFVPAASQSPVLS